MKDVLPNYNSHSRLGFAEGRERGQQLLGAMMEGQFTSFFAGKPSPLAKDGRCRSKGQGGRDGRCGCQCR
jgi:hypothetical protein